MHLSSAGTGEWVALELRMSLMSKCNAVILHLSFEFTQISASLTWFLSRVILCICRG